MKELLDLKFMILPALEDIACGRKYRRKSKKGNGNSVVPNAKEWFKGKVTTDAAN